MRVSVEEPVNTHNRRYLRSGLATSSGPRSSALASSLSIVVRDAKSSAGWRASPSSSTRVMGPSFSSWSDVSDDNCDRGIVGRAIDRSSGEFSFSEAGRWYRTRPRRMNSCRRAAKKKNTHQQRVADALDELRILNVPVFVAVRLLLPAAAEAPHEEVERPLFPLLSSPGIPSLDEFEVQRPVPESQVDEYHDQEVAAGVLAEEPAEGRRPSVLDGYGPLVRGGDREIVDHEKGLRGR